MKKRSLYILPVVLVILVTLGFKTISENDRYFQIVKNLDIFATLYKEVNTYYVDEVNPSQLIKVGIDAMLTSLDPYTDYIPEDDIEDYMTMATGEYGGIGIRTSPIDGVNTVVMKYAGSPADSAGLQIGDQILAIDGVELADKSHDQINQLMKGQIDSDVRLQVRRFGKKDPFELDVERRKITIKNVPYYGLVTDEIGYIRLSDFTTSAGREVATALVRLKSEGATKIILDLRENPGGLLDEAINVSNVFVPKGVEIVSTRGKIDSWTKQYNAPAEPVDREIPIAVLTSNGSASASEIVSGVMQDYDRGVLIGRKTYGKGLVQQTRPLAYNAQLKVTTAKYYIPSGRCIQAIDYSLRNADGSVGSIPDSLKTEFKTSIGRKVYDGGGLNPDVEVAQADFSMLTYTLLRRNMIFNYATQYYYSHPQIASAKEFKLTETEYQEFLKWLDKQKLDYTTPVETKLSELIKVAENEGTFDPLAGQIEELKDVIADIKASDIKKYKKEIKALLEQEIAGRYYLEKGQIESAFRNDADILTAVEVLDDPARYQKILSAPL